MCSKTFSFNLPTRIEFGNGVSATVGSEAKALGGSCVLLVTDPGVRKAGVIDSIENCLVETGLKVVVFDDVAPNPRDISITEGAALAKHENCDMVVAVGGGSAIDTAKGITVVHKYGGTIQDYESDEEFWFKVPGEVTPLIAIPTTSGTGSEVTLWAIITDSKRSLKMGVGDPKMTAKVALLDPELTISLPRGITASTGMDALTHAIEAYTANCSNPLTDSLSLTSIRLISQNLRRAFANGEDRAARSDLMLGSLLAGVAFGNADTASVHAMAETIGGVYDTPHGVANAIYLPVVMDYNTLALPGKFATIAEAMGECVDSLSPMAAARKAVEAVRELSNDLRIPTAREVGVKDEDLRMLAERAQENLGTPDNPRNTTIEDYLELYKIAQKV
ncbi:MAG: iron-containing alcohol dehydrogenase [Desulfobacula sp.]|jgi:alcohol dehydrogenase|nr:iron-containing alcohol dehydrogenase [Desulfobacula sp.]